MYNVAESTVPANPRRRPRRGSTFRAEKGTGHPWRLFSRENENEISNASFAEDQKRQSKNCSVSVQSNVAATNTPLYPVPDLPRHVPGLA